MHWEKRGGEVGGEDVKEEEFTGAKREAVRVMKQLAMEAEARDKPLRRNALHSSEEEEVGRWRAEQDLRCDCFYSISLYFILFTLDFSSLQAF